MATRTVGVDMAKSPKKAAQKPKAVELVPDAWPRFERFIKQVVKAGPQHRPFPKKGKKVSAK